jgi:hypothetical protein
VVSVDRLIGNIARVVFIFLTQLFISVNSHAMNIYSNTVDARLVCLHKKRRI